MSRIEASSIPRHDPDISGSGDTQNLLISDDRIRQISVQLFEFAMSHVEGRTQRTSLTYISPMNRPELDYWDEEFGILGATVDAADAGNLFVLKNEETDAMLPHVEYHKYSQMEPATIEAPYFFFLPIVRVGVGKVPTVTLELYVGVKDDNKKWVVERDVREHKFTPQKHYSDRANQFFAESARKSQKEAKVGTGFYPYYPTIVQFFIHKDADPRVQFGGTERINALVLSANESKSLMKANLPGDRATRVLFWTLDRLIQRNALPKASKNTLSEKRPAMDPNILRMLQDKQRELKSLQKPEDSKEEV